MLCVNVQWCVCGMVPCIGGTVSAVYAFVLSVWCGMCDVLCILHMQCVCVDVVSVGVAACVVYVCVYVYIYT